MGITPPAEYSDAAKKAADTVSMHAIAGNYGKFVALRLIDGGSDGVVYDTYSDAVSHQLHEQYCFYIKVPVDGMKPQEADSCIRWARFAYDNGFRPSSYGDAQPIMPLDKNVLNKIAPKRKYS